ncbi:TolC family protein [Chondrinema litorale]|uniref:TolC family protein n=1 Tax=Chondrinema litorale TaxID=2994555 RepID=UPI00254382D4|nr:TolC family protein [Chondrinema litorale]UZR94667.1 TolC family protein [Chondrinema litorale]
MTRFILILVLFTPSLGIAQSPVAESALLDSYVAEGLENNLQLVQENLSVDQRWTAIQEARGQFLPAVSFQSDYTLAEGGRSIYFPVGDLLNPVYNSLNQLTGSSDFPSNLENVNEQFLPNNFHNTRLHLVQPIFNLDINHNLNIREHELTAQEAHREAFKNQLVKDIKVTYFNYQQSEQIVEVLAQSEVVLKEVLRVNKKLVENQKATKEIVYRSEFELSQLAQQQAEAQQSVIAARNYFNFLLNRPLTTPIETEEDQQALPVDLSIDSTKTQQALLNRQELRQLTNIKEATLEALKMQQHQRLPSIAAVLDVGYQGFGYEFDDNQKYWMAAFSLKWDLFTGFQNRARRQRFALKGKQLEQQINVLEQQIQLEVNDHQQQLQAAYTAWQATRQGVRSAEQNFTLVSKKYQQQQASLLKLLDARSTLTRSKLQTTVAQFDYLKKAALLESSLGVAVLEAGY